MSGRRLDAVLAVLAALIAIYSFATGQLFYGVAAGTVAGVFAIQATGRSVFRAIGKAEKKEGEGDGQQ
jgi:hypothetical protein